MNLFYCVYIVVYIFNQGCLGFSNFLSCLTPDEKNGLCIKIRSCKPLINLLEKEKPRPSQKTIDFLRKSHCGFEGNDPIVCCPVLEMNERTIAERQEPESSSDISDHPNSKLLPESCGNINEDRILGGNITDFYEFPWMALIGYNTKNGLQFKCGGSLISSRYVITAAHCVANFKDTLSIVRLGEYDLTTEKDCKVGKGCLPSVQDYKIEEATTHPSYYKPQLRNDIALLRLKEVVKFTFAIQPVCLPISKEERERDFNGEKVVVTGWGTTELGTHSSVLLKVILPVVPLKECAAVYKTTVLITKVQVCAGGEDGKDSCSGDSGGPLLFVGRTPDGGVGYIQHGIVSFGPRYCGTAGKPGVYTRVSIFVEWILNTIRS